MTREDYEKSWRESLDWYEDHLSAPVVMSFEQGLQELTDRIAARMETLLTRELNKERECLAKALTALKEIAAEDDGNPCLEGVCAIARRALADYSLASGGSGEG